MKRLIAIALTAVIGFAAAPAWSSTDHVEMGRSKSFGCSVCHGADGKKALPLERGGVSRLAGMDPLQFKASVQAYRTNQRFHPLMQFFVIPMTDLDVSDLAAYYASLK